MPIARINQLNMRYGSGGAPCSALYDETRAAHSDLQCSGVVGSDCSRVDTVLCGRPRDLT